MKKQVSGTSIQKQIHVYVYKKRFNNHKDGNVNHVEKGVTSINGAKTVTIHVENKRFYVSQNIYLFNCVSLSEIHNVDQQMLLWLQHLFPAPFPANFICTTQANFCLQ